MALKITGATKKAKGTLVSMRSRSTKRLDKLILGAVEKIADSQPYFQKHEIVYEVVGRADLIAALSAINAIPACRPWEFDEITRNYIENAVSGVLGSKDENGLRLFECYAAGQRERRWMKFRGMKASDLRTVIAQTRVAQVSIGIKVDVYQHFLDEMEKMTKATGQEATTNDVYDQAVSRLQEAREEARREATA